MGNNLFFENEMNEEEEEEEVEETAEIRLLQVNTGSLPSLIHLELLQIQPYRKSFHQ